MTNQGYMKAFREARKVMGFAHTSAYVPSNKLADFSLYVERLKAERMLELCELLPTSRERVALASRNTTDLPSPEVVMQYASRFPNQPAIQKQAAECVSELEKANSTMNVARMNVDSSEVEVTKWMSLAVAHNHMANVLWRELAHAATQVQVDA